MESVLKKIKCRLPIMNRAEESSGEKRILLPEGEKMLNRQKNK